MTTAVREAPHHNTLTCYTDYSCRLPDCVERYNDRNRERLRAHKAGTWAELVDAEPARKHIESLQQDEGMSAEAVARIAGISVHSVIDILRPHPTKRRGRRRRITPDIEARILAVHPDAQASGRIDATGTIRRVQALVAIGWPVNHIARHAGLSGENAYDILNRPRVYVATAKAIGKTYDSLRRKKPEKHGVTKHHVTIAKNRAERMCWVPPTYWDRHPDGIDDPHFEPMYGITRLEIVAQDANEVMRFAGLNKADTADRLGVDKSYIDHAFREFPQYAVEVAA